MRQTDFDHACPGCGRVNQVASGAHDQVPEDGDATLCWNCGTLAVCVGTPVVGVRKPTEDELVEMMADENIQAAILQWSINQRPRDAVAAYEQGVPRE